MVAVITFPDKLLDALNYHEQKVQKNKAECLHAENFLLDKDQLNFYDKLNRFKNQMALNSRIETNLLHVSINFEPSEKIEKEELLKIGTVYMEKIGFGNQPYLVYQHNDAGHPHIHILTTTIKSDGSPIYTHNIGRNQSSRARTEIEDEFRLIKAVGRNNRQNHEIEPVDIEKVIYGKSETKRGITNVLDQVLLKYKYASLAELNAILKIANVLADRGQEDGRIYKTNGLVYRVLENGNKIGKPIKASSIYNKPTLAFLQQQFEKNKPAKLSCRTGVKKLVTKALANAESMQQFIRSLKQMKIDTVLRQNAAGLIYGITFIDHNSKSVFNGSDLGKELTAAHIQQKFATPLETPQKPRLDNPTQAKTESSDKNIPPASKQQSEIKFEAIRDKEKSHDEMIKQFDLLKQLIRAEKTFNQLPFELTGRKKKKKKKRKPSI